MLRSIGVFFYVVSVSILVGLARAPPSPAPAPRLPVLAGAKHI